MSEYRLFRRALRTLLLSGTHERTASLCSSDTPEQFAAFLGQEMAKFAKIVKASGMTATN